MPQGASAAGLQYALKWFKKPLTIPEGAPLIALIVTLSMTDRYAASGCKEEQWCGWCGGTDHKTRGHQNCVFNPKGHVRSIPNARRAYCECATSRCYRLRGCRLRGRLCRRLRECLRRAERMADEGVIEERVRAHANPEERVRHLAPVYSLNRATTTGIRVVDRPDVAVHWCPRSRSWVRRRLVVYEKRGRRLHRLPEWPHAILSELPGCALRMRVAWD